MLDHFYTTIFRIIATDEEPPHLSIRCQNCFMYFRNIKDAYDHLPRGTNAPKGECPIPPELEFE